MKLQNDTATLAFQEIKQTHDLPEAEKIIAQDYIQGLREEQFEIIGLEDWKNMKDAKTRVKDINILEKEIQDIRVNKKVRLRPKIIAKRFLGLLQKVWRFLRVNKVKLGWLALSSLIGLIMFLLNAITLRKTGRSIISNVKHAANTIANGVGQAIQTLGLIEGKTIRQYAYYLENLIALLFGAVGSLTYGGYYFLISSCTLLIFNFIQYYMTYVPQRLDLEEFSTSLDAMSYTVVGEVPPEEVLEELAEQQQLPLEKVRETETKRSLENKPPNIYQKVVSKAVRASSKVVLLTDKVVDNGEKIVTTVVITGNKVVHKTLETMDAIVSFDYKQGLILVLAILLALLLKIV